MKKVIITVIAALAVLMSLTSCEEESKIYEAKIANACYMDLLNTGLPFMKIQIDEVYFNDDLVVSNIAAPSYDGGRVDSEYFNVESGIDYEIKIVFTTYLYNADEFTWDDGTEEEYVAGTESWTNDEEHSKFALKFTVGDIFNAYRPEFETFYVE